MYSVSQEYINAVMSSSVYCTWYGTIKTEKGNTYQINDSNIAMSSSSFAHEIVTGNGIEIGTACASSLKLNIYLDYDEDNNNYLLNGQIVDRYEFFGATINLKFRLFFDGSQTNYEDVTLKTFEASEAVRTSDVLSLTAYDKMLNFETGLGATPSEGIPYAYIRAACDACRIELGTSWDEIANMSNGGLTVFINPLADDGIETWKDLLQYVLQLLGAFAVIGNDDKLYIKQYKMEPNRQIPLDWRYNSYIADFETNYTALTATYKTSGTDETVVVSPNTGLTYKLGVNPFLQFSLDETRRQALQSITNEISTFKYTPFEASCPIDPSFECGDIIELVGGQAVEGKYAVVTSISYTLSGSLELKCVGENPKLQNVKSKLAKMLDSNSSTESQDTMHYYDYTNEEDIVIRDGQRGLILHFNYISVRPTHIDFHAQLTLYVDTIETELDEDWWEENSGNIKLTYYLGGEEVFDYYPLEEYLDGYHQLSLSYAFGAVADDRGSFDVFLSVEGADIYIGAKQARAYIAGAGIIGEDAWDGTLSVFDDFKGFSLAPVIGKMQDDGIVKLVGVTNTGYEDNFHFNISDLFGTFTDEAGATANILTLTPFVNTSYFSSDCEISGSSFIGKGSNVQETSGYMITDSIYGVTKVDGVSLNAIYYASFDGGATWKGYTNNGWIVDAPMILADMRVIPSEAWSLEGNNVRIKVLLEQGASIGSLNMYGGRIE